MGATAYVGEGGYLLYSQWVSDLEGVEVRSELKPDRPPVPRNTRSKLECRGAADDRMVEKYPLGYGDSPPEEEGTNGKEPVVA